MKKSNAVLLVNLLSALGIVLGSIGAPAARADDLSPYSHTGRPLEKDVQADYAKAIATHPEIVLGIMGTGNLAVTALACGVDSVDLIATAIGDTVLVAGIAVEIGHWILNFFGDKYAVSRRVVTERRWTENEKSTALLFGYALGGPIPIIATGVLETLSNAATLVEQRSLDGVDYSTTRAAVKGTYFETAAVFEEHFRDKSSICRHQLWKLHALASAAAGRAPVMTAVETDPSGTAKTGASDPAPSTASPSEEPNPPKAAALTDTAPLVDAAQ